MRPAAALTALLLAACAGAPVTHWHSLMPPETTLRADGAPAAGDLVLQIDAPVLPRQLDQPQWLLRQADGRLVTLEHERWSTALGDELRAALAARLVQRWGATDARAAAAPPAWKLTLQMVDLESWPGHEVRWDALWSLQGGSASLTCRSVLRETVSATTYEGLASAHRAALRGLGDAIGQRLLALQRGARPACESPG